MHHHEYADIFPLMEGASLAALTDDIIAHGQRESIKTLEGKILDGRNRYRACLDAGLEPLLEPFTGDDALQWVISSNLHRRHLTESQRSMIAAKLANLGRGKPQHGNSANLPNYEQSKAAQSLNVSLRSVGNAKRVQRDGVPELAAAVTAGEVSVSKAAALAKESPEDQADAVADKSFVHVTANSGNNEWYTPPAYIEAARATMGGIDLDPASCEIANGNVKAGTFYTVETNGLEQQWKGRVWMNPPYSGSLIKQFAHKLCAEWKDGNLDAACVLVNNGTETTWVQVMATSCAAVCFPKGRIKFLDANGTPAKTPLQGQAILYFGTNTDSFSKAFSDIGQVLMPS